MPTTNPPPLPLLHTECGECQGNGIVTAPGWLAYDAECKQARQEWLAANPGGVWYSSHEGREWEAGYPDEAETSCPDCDGTGYQMTKAGREILYFLRVHGKG
jgi:Ribonuclease G/E